MNVSNIYDPKELAKVLIGLSLPDTPSGPFRNRRSLFVQKDESISTVLPSTELDSISGTPNDSSAGRSAANLTRSENTSKLSVGRHSTFDRSLVTKATSSLTHTPNPVPASGADVILTPPIKRSLSRNSYCMYTDPGKTRSSKQFDSDNKKRRVSFHPSQEVTEYRGSAQTDPYLLPLNDALNHKFSNTTDTLVTHRNSVDSVSPPPTGEPDLPSDVIKNSVLFEIYPEDREDLSAVFEPRNDGSISGLLVPQQIKEQLAKLVTSKQAVKHSVRKSVITEYAALQTPTKISPIKCKLSFPPLCLDPLHPTLRCPRKKGSKQSPVIKLCIERDDAFIPTSFFKNWYTKSTHNSFLPASTSQWLQDYSTGLIEHFLKLVRARCGDRKVGDKYLATTKDLVAVIREYLELDDSININNIIHTYLPMELWFTYLP